MAEWLRYDVGLLSHPKFSSVPERQRDKARLLYLALLEHAAEHETDGWILGARLRSIAEPVGVKRPGVTIDHLVEAGLVHRLDDPAELPVHCSSCGESADSLQFRRNFAANSPRRLRQVREDRRLDETAVFYIHDFLDKQPSRADHDLRREQAKERKKRMLARRAGQLQIGDEERRSIPFPELPGNAVPEEGRNAANRTRQQVVPVLSTGSSLRDAAREPAPHEQHDEPAAAVAESGEAPTIEHVLEALESLRRTDPGSAAVILPLALGVTTGEFDQTIADVKASSARNDAGLLVTLLKQRARQSGTRQGGTAAVDPSEADAERKAARLAQIAEDPDEHVARYARSLARLEPEAARQHVAALVEQLPIPAPQQAALTEIAARAHLEAARELTGQVAG